MLDGDFNIEGDGARSTVIQADPRSRVAYVSRPPTSRSSVSVTLRGDRDRGRGGARRRLPRSAEGSLVLSRCTVSENFAAGGGGGISTAGVVQRAVDRRRSTLPGDGRPGGRGRWDPRGAGGEAVLVNATVSATWPARARTTSLGEAAASTRQARSRSSTRRSQATTRPRVAAGTRRGRRGPGMEMVNFFLAENSEQDLRRPGPGRRGAPTTSRTTATGELDAEGDLQDADAGLQPLRD